MVCGGRKHTKYVKTVNCPLSTQHFFQGDIVLLKILPLQDFGNDLLVCCFKDTRNMSRVWITMLLLQESVPPFRDIAKLRVEFLLLPLEESESKGIVTKSERKFMCST